MAFEIGKEYVFKQNDFEISRESGNLYFLVHDPASASVYKIKPFEFQTTDLPEKLVCTYCGDDKFEQNIGSVLPQVYKVGDVCKFRVMRQDYTTGQLSLRDDLNGLNHFPVDLGKRRFKRFERINCRIQDVVDGRLQMEYVADTAAATPFFSFEELISLPVAAPLERHGVVSRLLGEAPFGEARMMRENRDVSWVRAALEVIDCNLPHWVGGRLRGRMVWFERLRAFVISLIEESPYLNLFPHGERGAMQERLSMIIRRCEDNLHAARLVIEGNEEQVITSTLSSLARSGWLYNPEKKMRTMMAIFSFRPSIDDSYIGEVFRIIKDNHADERFRELFVKGFIEMLNIYISNESKSLDPYNRPLLRKLAEAIAIELLLTADIDFNQWNNHRGLLYTIAALLVRRTDTPLAQKAFGAFTQRLDMPLEFAWRDLDDMMRLCHTRLSVPLPSSGAGAGDGVAVFEGEDARVEISGNNIAVMPPAVGSNTKRVFSRAVARDMTFSVMANVRLAEKFPGDGLNLCDHHLFWNELEKTLSDKKSQPVTAAPAMLSGKSAPEVGAEVTIRITGRDEDDEHTFHCVIEDDSCEGKGTLTTRDIVQYPVKAFFDTFCHEGRPMLFKATVVAVDGHRHCQFSMRKQAMAEAIRIARNDRDSNDAIKAVITGETDKLFLGVTAGGYPISVLRTPQMSFAKNAAVWVVVTRVNFDPEKDTLYISAHVDGAAEGGAPEENYTFVKDSFQYLLQEMSDLRTYTAPACDEPVADVAPRDVAHEIYLAPREMANLSQLLDGMAMVQQENLTESYTLLAMARLISVVSGDIYRAEYLAAKMSLVEKLSTFAINGKLDKQQVDLLAERCMRIAPSDCDMNRKLDVLRALAVIDRPADESIALVAQPSRNDDNLTALRRMVVSYNFMRGLGLGQLRTEMMERIVNHLHLPMPTIDTTVVNEKEDQFNEFKESLFFPANNNMHPDAQKQVRELMEVTCGFLNSEGGTIYIGVNNQGVPKGLGTDFTYLNHGYGDFDLQDARDKFNLAFCKGLRDHFGVTVQGIALYPSLVELEHEEIDGKPICRVVIKPFHGMVRMADGNVFVRQDSSTVPIKTRREQAAFEKKRSTRANIVL